MANDSPTPSTNPTPAISEIATGLNIYTFQGLAVNNGNFILPTLDSKLLQVSPDGKVSTLVQFCEGFECGNFGAPFGIAIRRDEIFLTITPYAYGGRLVRVNSDKSVTTIADLESVCEEGGPFGLTISNGNFIITTAKHAVNSEGLLVRVTPSGRVSIIADVSEFGIPFAVIASNNNFIVTQERGQLLRVSPTGKISVIVNLLKADLGIPLAVVERNDEFVVTTNSGLLVRVTPQGKVATFAKLSRDEQGIPSGIISVDDSLIVSTTAGKLLRVKM